MSFYSIRTCLVCFVILQVPACLTVHVRHLTWQGMSARKECGWGILPMPKTVWFDYVSIYMDRNPAAFTLKMPNGDVIAAKDLTRQRLKPYFSSIKPLTEQYLPETEAAEIRFDNGSVMIMFIGEKVNRIDVGSWFPLSRHLPGTRASIGDAEGKKFLLFPATEQQLIEFLGKPLKAESYRFFT